MRDLTDRVVLLTGAAGGIGRALARRLSEAGAVLALVDRDQQGLDELAALHPTASVHPVDLLDRGAVAGLVPEVLGAHGRLDVLVCNAGWTVFGRFSEMTLDQIDGVLEVDLHSVVRLVHHALPALRARSGHIVLLSSMAGVQPFPFQTTYSAAKHGLAGFGDVLRMELAVEGIGVTTLLPGTIATGFLAHGDAHDPDLRVRLSGLMQRHGTSPDKVARAAMRGIRKNRGRLRVGWDSHLVGLVGHLAPGLVSWLLGRGVRRLGAPDVR